MRCVLTGLFLALFITSCAAPRKTTQPGAVPGMVEGQPDIRVLLGDRERRMSVASTGGFTVRTAEGMTLLEAPEGGTLTASGRYPYVELELDPGGRVATADGAVRVEPKSTSPLTVGSTSYGGIVSVSARSDGTLLLLNVVPLESYLEGVLPHEMGNPGPDGFDAMKSQAIAARTYAMGKMVSRAAEEFDVYASVLDQVYQGLNGRNKTASAAVGETRGQVLDYDGQMVRAYYCACCGGHTSDIRQIWPDREPADYLHGVPDHDARWPQAFCRENRYFRWRYSFTGRALGEILRETIPAELGVRESDVGALRDIRIDNRTSSGRVSSLTITTTRGEFTVTGDRIRWVLMTDLQRRRILPSVMFRLDKVYEKDQIAFVSIVGGGNGHGVGMCQNGAIAMSKKGYTYKMILEHYYPGCRVVKAY